MVMDGRIMNKYKIRRSTIEIVMLCISFYEFTGIPHSLFLSVKYSIIVFLILSHIRECKRMKEIVIAILLYGGTTFVATVAYQSELNHQVAAFVYMLHILSIYVTIKAFVQRRGIEELIKNLANIFLIFVLVTDVPMLFANYNFSDPSESYLIGNKFAVSYLHCFVTALLFCINSEKGRKGLFFRICRILFWLFSIMICRQVTCTTGILICIFMGVMIFCPISVGFKKMLASPQILIILTAIINVLILGSASLLTNPYIANFISNVLGKSYTWVGRLHIYAMIFDVIKIHPWIGYGYFSNIIEEILGFGNAQNGVLKIVVDSGIMGLVAYILLVYRSMKKARDSSEKRWSLIVFVYCMIIASIAEINLTDYLCFLTVAIIFSDEQKGKKLDNKKSEEERGKTGEKIVRKKRIFKWI